MGRVTLAAVAGALVTLLVGADPQYAGRIWIEHPVSGDLFPYRYTTEEVEGGGLAGLEVVDTITGAVFVLSHKRSLRQSQGEFCERPSIPDPILACDGSLRATYWIALPSR